MRERPNPPGASTEVWKAADEREPKRLLDRGRNQMSHVQLQWRFRGNFSLRPIDNTSTVSLLMLCDGGASIHLTLLTIGAVGLSSASAARGDTVLPAVGGGGGGPFQAVCPWNKTMVGILIQGGS